MVHFVVVAVFVAASEEQSLWVVGGEGGEGGEREERAKH
jgi:hypothetical protein